MPTQKELRKELSDLRKKVGCKSEKNQLNTKKGVESALSKMKSQVKPKAKLGLKPKSSYLDFVAKYRKEGKSMVEIGKMWNDAKK